MLNIFELIVQESKTTEKFQNKYRGVIHNQDQLLL